MKTLALLVLLTGGCGSVAQMNAIADFAMPDPVDAILNGANQASENTYWRDRSSSNFFLALFQDHTGVVGPSPKTPITWQKLSPVNIAVTGDSNLPSITQISGSVSSGRFVGAINGTSFYFTIAGGTF